MCRKKRNNLRLMFILNNVFFCICCFIVELGKMFAKCKITQEEQQDSFNKNVDI